MGCQKEAGLYTLKAQESRALGIPSIPCWKWGHCRKACITFTTPPHPQAPRMFSGNCISTRQDTGGLGENRRIQRKDQQTPALWDSLKINNKTDLQNYPRIKATCSGSLFMKPSTHHHFFRASLLNENRTSILAISSKLWIVVFHLLSGVWLYDPMDCSTPGSSVLHCLQEFAWIHVHWDVMDEYTFFQILKQSFPGIYALS